MPSGIIQNPRIGKNPKIPPITSRTPRPIRIGAEPGSRYFRPFNLINAKSLSETPMRWPRTLS